MRRTDLVLACLLFALLFSCKKQESATSSASPPAAAAAAQSTSAAPAANAPAADATDLVSLEQGAFVVVAPESIDYGTGAFRIIDGDPKAGFSGAEGKPTNQPIVIALPERCSIDRVQFDTGTAGLDTHTPRQVLVEMSDASATEGFKPIANVTLASQKDGQVFPADGSAAGRFVRLNVTANYGGGLTEIGEFRAYGKKLTDTPMPNVTGAYDTSAFRTLHLKQSGTNVTGCLGDPLTAVSGGIEGHVVKISIATADDQGPAILVFSPDHTNLLGGFWKTNGAEPSSGMTAFDGKKVSDQAGDCPGENTPEKQMAKALEEEKRLRLYGINFDSDSDRLRDESKPTLDLVAQVLKAHPDWKLTIEGHTDSTATAEHNQQLSVARSNSVKAYLTGAGVDAARLTAAGFGATRPVASNETPLGRAANRRVELVRE